MVGREDRPKWQLHRKMEGKEEGSGGEGASLEDFKERYTKIILIPLRT